MFESVKTPGHLKEIESYEGGHMILSDGWVLKELIDKQIGWLERLLSTEHSLQG